MIQNQHPSHLPCYLTGCEKLWISEEYQEFWLSNNGKRGRGGLNGHLDAHQRDDHLHSFSHAWWTCSRTSACNLGWRKHQMSQKDLAHLLEAFLDGITILN